MPNEEMKRLFNVEEPTESEKVANAFSESQLAGEEKKEKSEKAVSGEIVPRGPQRAGWVIENAPKGPSVDDNASSQTDPAQSPNRELSQSAQNQREMTQEMPENVVQEAPPAPPSPAKPSFLGRVRTVLGFKKRNDTER